MTIPRIEEVEAALLEAAPFYAAHGHRPVPTLPAGNDGRHKALGPLRRIAIDAHVEGHGPAPEDMALAADLLRHLRGDGEELRGALLVGVDLTAAPLAWRLTDSDLRAADIALADGAVIRRSLAAGAALTLAANGLLEVTACNLVGARVTLTESGYATLSGSDLRGTRVVAVPQQLDLSRCRINAATTLDPIEPPTTGENRQGWEPAFDGRVLTGEVLLARGWEDHGDGSWTLP